MEVEFTFEIENLRQLKAQTGVTCHVSHLSQRVILIHDSLKVNIQVPILISKYRRGSVNLTSDHLSGLC